MNMSVKTFKTKESKCIDTLEISLILKYLRNKKLENKSLRSVYIILIIL